jgi:hypothetical protein
MTTRIKLRPNKNLNGKVYTMQDIYATLNNIQKQHIDGVLDVYAPIMREGMQYPSIAWQWKNDAYNNRYRHG